MLPLLSHIWLAASDWVWPRACHLCGARITDARPRCLCDPCEAAITADPQPTCSRCSSTVGPHVDTAAGCPACRNHSFRFTSAVRLGPYDGMLRESVLKSKQPGAGGLAETLGRAFAAAREVQLRACGAEVVVPVPLHWRRWWSRRHNQAEAIARGVAAGLGLPVLRRTLWRVRWTPPQAGGSREQRWANASGAFRVPPWVRLRGVRVLLVDDVLTTGATADAAAAALGRGGAAQVHVAVLAHR